MAKQTLAERINSAIQKNDVRGGLVPVGHGPQVPPARTYLSPSDSYEDEIGYDSPVVGHAPGMRRGMWQVYEQQQAHVPVTNLTSSGNTNNNAVAAIQGGLTQNPVAPAATWAVVPQMILPVRAQGPVHIIANVSVRSSIANDIPGFALYRDGNLLGNHLTHTTPATVSASSIVQLSVLDTPTTGQHIYALYWSPGTGTLIANSNQRNMYAINLTPQ